VQQLKEMLSCLKFKKRALNTFSGTLTETAEPMKTLFGLGCGQTGPKKHDA